MKQVEFIEKEKRNANLVKYYKDHPGISFRALGAIFKISGARANQIIIRAKFKEGLSRKEKV
jgi:hypothetical protein